MKKGDSDQLLARLSVSLEKILGDDIEEILLYGSYARGDAGEDSDLDVLIVLRAEFDYAEMIRRTSELVSGLSLEHDIVISRAFITKAELKNGRSPFVINVQREAIPI